jgi:hypothetical protein
MKLFLSLFILIATAACSLMPTPPVARLIGVRDVHPRIRNAIGMRPNQQLESCGNLVLFDSSRQLSVEGDPDPTKLLEVIVSADGPKNYYDNRSGALVAACGFWYCGYDNKNCASTCPPSQWTCSKLVP